MSVSTLEVNNMSDPITVEPGDKVRVVAPAGQGATLNLSKIKIYVESLGLSAQISEGIYDITDPFYSNSDEFRANDLISALTDDDCKVIWCIKGGAGSIRLIKYLEAQLPVTPAPSPKILIGFSDITVLHLYLARKYNWPTIHGAMLEGIVSGFYDDNPESITALTNYLFNGPPLCVPNMTRIDGGVVLPSITAYTTGGNMTLVQCSIGTEWEVNAAGKFLFLEDTGEAPYKIERMLDHMKQAGVFNDAAAIIFGDFTDADPDMVSYVLKRFAQEETITSPVLTLKGIGHEKENFPLLLNTNGLMVLSNVFLDEYRLCFGSVVSG